MDTSPIHDDAVHARVWHICHCCLFQSTKTLTPKHSFQLLTQAYFNFVKTQKKSEDLWVSQTKRKVLIKKNLSCGILVQSRDNMWHVLQGHREKELQQLRFYLSCRKFTIFTLFSLRVSHFAQRPMRITANLKKNSVEASCSLHRPTKWRHIRFKLKFQKAKKWRFHWARCSSICNPLGSCPFILRVAGFHMA